MINNISHYFNVLYFINDSDRLHGETEKASVNNLLLIYIKKKDKCLLQVDMTRKLLPENDLIILWILKDLC